MKNVEVLLREHVENLGRCGDVVRVRAGHARNYLFPRRLAVQANEENKRIMARRWDPSLPDAEAAKAATAPAAWPDLAADAAVGQARPNA